MTKGHERDSLLVVPGEMAAESGPTRVAGLLEHPGIDLLLIAGELVESWHAERIAADNPNRARVFHCPDPNDEGRVLRWGFRFALASDHQTVVMVRPLAALPDPGQVSTMRRALEEAQVVVGAGPEEHGRRAPGQITAALIQRLAGLPTANLAAPLKGFDREVIEALQSQRLRGRGLALQLDLARQCAAHDWRIIEVGLRQAQDDPRARPRSLLDE